ncbi:ATP-binding_protein [Hexamita inflata]|uniref:ATP-binding protein n=2 Tax=Hexamita inflata TaxID=28002 RepID=A0AA86U089_9EUKA|nr:ATP-binding protein [Hexamita inflata]
MQLQNSIINISISHYVVKCALICLKCDINVNSSELILQAEGQVLSGLALEIEAILQVTNSNIQFRFITIHGAGFVNIIKESIETFQIINSTMSGTSLINSSSNGYIVSDLLLDTDLNISNVIVCSDLVSVGESTYKLTTSNQINTDCSICGDKYVVYGICLSELVNSVHVEGVLICVFPFEFRNMQCLCSAGYELNLTICVGTISQLTMLNNNFSQSIAQTTDFIYLVQEQCETKIAQLDNKTQIQLLNVRDQINSDIYSNITNLEHLILASAFQLESYFNRTIQQLDQQVFNNVSSTTHFLENQIMQNISQLNQSILSHITLSDQYVVSNNTKMETYVNNTKQILENYIIVNLSTQKLQIEDQIKSLQHNLEQQMLSNDSYIELQIVNNVTAFYNRISLLNASQQAALEQVKQQTYTNLSQYTHDVNQNIVSNISQLKTYIDNKIILNDQMFQQNISSLEKYVNNTKDNIEQMLDQNITQLRTKLQNQIGVSINNIMNQMVDNSTILEQRINGNYSNIQSQINNLALTTQTSVEAVRSQAYSNQTANFNLLNLNLNNNITTLQNSLLNKISINSSVLEQMIISNVTSVNSNMNIQNSNILTQIGITNSQQSQINNNMNQLLLAMSRLGAQVCVINGKSFNQGNGQCE